MEKVSRICPVCGGQYKANPVRLKWGRETTCGRDCSYKFRATKLTKAVTLTCSVCGKQFERPPSHVKSKHEGVFCSPACQYEGRSLGLTKRIVTKPYSISEEWHRRLQEKGKWLAELRKQQGYGHTKATRRKLSKITAENIANGKIKRVSGIEYIVAKELARLSIPFIHQYRFRDPLGRFAACVDFWLPNHNAVIEVNGTFWHADPRFYDRGNLTPAQRRTIERYTRKVNLLKDRGIPLIEIWEADIRQSPSDAVANALAPIIG